MEAPAGTEVEARHLKKRNRWRRAVLQEDITPDSVLVKIKFVGETAVHPVPLVDLKLSKLAHVKSVPENKPPSPRVHRPAVEVIDVDSDSPASGDRRDRFGTSSTAHPDVCVRDGGMENGREMWRDWLQQRTESEKMAKARRQEETRRKFIRPRGDGRKSEDKGDGGRHDSVLGGLMMQKRQLDGYLDQGKSLYAKVLRVEDRNAGGTKRGHEGGEALRDWVNGDAHPYRQETSSKWRDGPSSRQPEGEHGQHEGRESWDVKRRRMGSATRESITPHNSNTRTAVDDAPIERHPVSVAPEDLSYRIPRRHVSYDSGLRRFPFAAPSWPPMGRRTEEVGERDRFRSQIEFEETDETDSGDGGMLPRASAAGRRRGRGEKEVASRSARDGTTEKARKSVFSHALKPKPKEEVWKRPPASRVATRYCPSGSPFLGTIDCDEEDTKILELCADMMIGGQVSDAVEESEQASVLREVTVRGKGRKSSKPRRWCRPFVMQQKECYAKPIRIQEDNPGKVPARKELKVSFNSAIRSRCWAFSNGGFSAPFLVDCACGESDLNNDGREDAVQCRMCGLWSHLRCTQFAGTSSNVLPGKAGSRKRFTCLRCMDKLTLSMSRHANMADSNSEDSQDESGENRTDGDDELLAVQIRSLRSILCQMEDGVVKTESEGGDGHRGKTVTRPPLSVDEVEARVENIETLRSGVCRPSTGVRERNLLDLLTRQKQACS